MPEGGRWVAAERRLSARPRRGAVAAGLAGSLPPLSSGGARVTSPWQLLRIALIEPGVQVSRIRLADKTARRRLRMASSSGCQAHEPVVPVWVRQ
jgi:hypothetical protein